MKMAAALIGLSWVSLVPAVSMARPEGALANPLESSTTAYNELEKAREGMKRACDLVRATYGQDLLAEAASLKKTLKTYLNKIPAETQERFSVLRKKVIAANEAHRAHLLKSKSIEAEFSKKHKLLVLEKNPTVDSFKRLEAEKAKVMADWERVARLLKGKTVDAAEEFAKAFYEFFYDTQKDKLKPEWDFARSRSGREHERSHISYISDRTSLRNSKYELDQARDNWNFLLIKDGNDPWGSFDPFLVRIGIYLENKELELVYHFGSDIIQINFGDTPEGGTAYQSEYGREKLPKDCVEVYKTGKAWSDLGETPKSAQSSSTAKILPDLISLEGDGVSPVKGKATVIP